MDTVQTVCQVGEANDDTLIGVNNDQAAILIKESEDMAQHSLTNSESKVEEGGDGSVTNHSDKNYFAVQNEEVNNSVIQYWTRIWL